MTRATTRAPKAMIPLIPLIDEARDRVARIVARNLRLDPAEIDPETPLALYGLDSVSSIELVADLEEAFGTSLPESLVVEHPSLEGIARALSIEGGEEHDELKQILADSRLPDAIRPSGAPARAPRRVLLTGATGFLGAYLLRDLLNETEAEIWCLVRQAEGDPLGRIRANLARYGLQSAISFDRIRPIEGDLRLPRLGLTPGDHAMLAESLDAIFHAAADVNWVLPYAALRHANVIATRELLELACVRRAKAFHFVSSLSVCYATGGPAVVSEDDDMFPYVDRLPLGYARSKCVAESLVRQAAARGLRAQIHRPSLLAGDSRTGVSNVDDLVAMLIKGCIEMRAAPDLDWTFDAMPVDDVSRAIVGLANQPDRLAAAASHLFHHAPRHWRECVLWMNLFGYVVALTPYEEWQRRLEHESRSPTHALHRLRNFFLRRDSSGATVPELYEQARRSAVRDDITRAATAAAGLPCSRLDAELFDRYFASYIARGFLSPPPLGRWSKPSPRRAPACYEDPRFFEPLLKTHFQDASLRVCDLALQPLGGNESIISELTSWRRGRRSGLFRCRLTVERSASTEAFDLIVKAKPSDLDAIEVGETVAALCNDDLGRAFRDHRQRVGLTNSHLRELAAYETQDERWRRHSPVCFGTWRDDWRGEWIVALEDVRDAVLMDATDSPELWSAAHIDAAIAGLSEIHAVWYDRERDPGGKPWLGETLSRDRAVDLMPLWRALATHAAPYFTSWAGSDMAQIHRRAVESIAEWWEPLDSLPRTVIHNDFSPRNVALRRQGEGFRVCAYDWELATFGPPQRDLAEFLCFVLAPDVAAAEVERLVELHRRLLASATGWHIAPEAWRAGFGSALADLLIDKLAFYAMVHRIRRQRFLPRVVRTWRRLYELAASRIPR